MLLERGQPRLQRINEDGVRRVSVRCDIDAGGVIGVYQRRRGLILAHRVAQIGAVKAALNDVSEEGAPPVLSIRRNIRRGRAVGGLAFERRNREPSPRVELTVGEENVRRPHVPASVFLVDGGDVRAACDRASVVPDAVLQPAVDGFDFRQKAGWA